MAEEALLLFETYSGLVCEVTKAFSANRTISAQDFRLMVKSRLASAKALCASYPDPYLQQAEFAVCAYVDEYVLAGNWLGGLEWRSNLLQDEYFNTTDAGILFYNRCNQLTAEQPDLVHLYFFCLASGFRGQYYSSDMNDSIHQCMQALLAKLGQETEPNQLAEQGLLIDGQAKPQTPRLRDKYGYYLWFAIPALIWLCVFGYYFFTMLHGVQAYLAGSS